MTGLQSDPPPEPAPRLWSQVRLALALVAAGALIGAALEAIAGPGPAPAPEPGGAPAEAAGDEGGVLAADELVARVDPEVDAWQSEVANERAGALLGRIAQRFESGGPLDAAFLAPLVDPGFACTRLRPPEAELVRDAGGITVARWSAAPGEAARPEQGGAAALARELEALCSLLSDGERHAKFKVVHVEEGEGGFATGILVELSSLGAPARQVNATWSATWSEGDPDQEGEVRLSSVLLERFEEVVVDGGALFEDCTRSAMGHLAAYEGQVLPGIPHWTVRMASLVGMQIFGHHGLAIDDVDGDGLDDLYVGDAGGLPNRLYLQREDGTLEDASARSGTDWLDLTTGVLLVDLDGDADPDLVVSTISRLLIAENLGEGGGTGRFEERLSLRAAAEPYSLCAGDYDLDGDLDLYVCGYGAGGDPGRSSVPRLGDSGVTPVPYHDARNGGRNALLRNEGDFAFIDVTAEVGLDEANTRFSFAASFEDYDGDGDPDLYVANDFGRNNLYRNDGGRFRDVAAEAGVEDVASGMSVAWGDYDGDGRMDVYVGNMFSSAGQRVTYQRRFAEAVSSDTARDARRMARGNTLFRNRGDGTFDDVSEPAGVTMGRWAWSSCFGDLDLDGRQDLVVANGYFTNQDPADL